MGYWKGYPPSVPLIPKKPKRPIRQRQPFDIYEDQYQVLKKIATAERGFENGRSMGQMVREAIDDSGRKTSDWLRDALLEKARKG